MVQLKIYTQRIIIIIGVVKLKGKGGKWYSNDHNVFNGFRKLRVNGIFNTNYCKL